MRSTTAPQRVIVLASLLSGGCLPGREAHPGVQVGVGEGGALTAVTSSGASLKIELPADLIDSTAARVDLAGAVGETVGFDFRLCVSGGKFSALDLVIGPLMSDRDATFPAEFDVYRLHGVPTPRRPGWHVRFAPASRWETRVNDIAVPRSAPTGGLPARVASGERMALLAEVEVPDGTAPATYSGSVAVVDGGRTLVEIPLRLTVCPVVLPKVASVELLADVAAASLTGDGREVWLDGAVDLLRSHGLVPVLSGVYPVVKVNRSGRVRVDWEAFDRAVGVHLDAAGGAWCRIPFDESFPAGAMSASADDAEATEFATGYLRACAEHFASRGWLARSFLQTPRSTGSGDTLDAIRRVTGWGRLADRRLRTVVALDRDHASAIGWSDIAAVGAGKWVDVWCPPARSVETTGTGPRETWTGSDQPPYSGSVDVIGAESVARVLPWQARRYGMSKVLLGDAAGLLHSGEPFGLSGPVASVRLKSLRRGLRDMAYLDLLDSLGRSRVSARLMDVLSPYAMAEASGFHAADARGLGWAQGGESWALARRVMAGEVMAASDVGEGHGVSLWDTALVWRRLLGEAADLVMTVEGVRVRAGRQVGESLVEFSVMLDNRTERAVGGRLAFGRLPFGWRGGAETPVIAAIPPLERRRAVLMTRTASLAWDGRGVIEVPIVLRSDGSETYATTARVCYIASQRRSNPVVIDGDLSEWTTGSGNVASGFVSVSGDGASGSGTADATRCLVGHDDTHMFIAIHSPAPPRTGAVVHRNVVEYEDMIPIGQPAVEVLIDPTNAGTYAPEDLYHIVIQPGGAVFERGIGTQPSVGPRRVWAADIRYASRISDDRWIVELSVPFDAFVPSGGDKPVWGLNFARYDAESQIYATWSGARYNAYLPVSLGNLVFP